MQIKFATMNPATGLWVGFLWDEYLNGLYVSLLPPFVIKFMFGPIAQANRAAVS